MKSMKEPAVRSPCTKRCRLNSATGLCEGCCRTMDEIVRWGGAGEEERRRILAAVAVRAAVRDCGALDGKRPGAGPGTKPGTAPG
jgi:predicted Fe-S protein YdhL (DUF1289 family)